MRILYFFLLVAGPYCVRGQLPQGRMNLPPMSSAIPKWDPGATWDPGKKMVIPGPLLEKPGYGGALLLSGNDPRVRLMPPDGMPCLVPSLQKVEKMPVDRRRNADRMPNRVGRGQ